MKRTSAFVGFLCLFISWPAFAGDSLYGRVVAVREAHTVTFDYRRARRRRGERRRSAHHHRRRCVVLPQVRPAEPLDEGTATAACQNIRNHFRREDCVMALGDTVFARTYGTQRVSARFIPAKGSAFLASSSVEKTHDVKREGGK